MSVYKKEENNHLLNLIEMRFGGYWNLDKEFEGCSIINLILYVKIILNHFIFLSSRTQFSYQHLI